MRKPFLFVLILSGNICYAQHVTVANKNLNIAYVGVDNIISATAEGYSTDSITLSVDHRDATINLTDKKGEFIFRPTIPGKCYLDVMTMKNGQLLKVGACEYRIKYPPQPVMRLGFKRFGYMSIERLNAHPELILRVENFDYDIDYIVNSFTLSVTRDGKEFYKHDNKGGHFDKALSGFIKQLKTGDSIIISSIKAAANDILIYESNDQSEAAFRIVEFAKDPYNKED